MNLLIGFVVILCLVVCELNSQTPVVDVWTRVVAMLLIAACVPALAIFQTFTFSRRAKHSVLTYQQRQSSLNRLVVCHSAVWLVASLMIVCSIKWQIVVRENWGLDRWPLVDETLILLPILLSLLASWWIFYDVRQPVETESEQRAWIRRVFDSNRISFVAIRFRVYAALTLLPIAVFVLMRDLSQLFENFPTVSVIGAVPGNVAGLPWLPVPDRDHVEPQTDRRSGTKGEFSGSSAANTDSRFLAYASGIRTIRS